MNALANWVLAGPVVLGKFAIYDYHHRGTGCIRGSQVAPAKQRYAHCAEVLAHRLAAPRRAQRRALGRHITLCIHRAITLLARSGQHVRHPYSLHARQLAELVEQRGIECVNGLLRGVLMPGQSE